VGKGNVQNLHIAGLIELNEGIMSAKIKPTFAIVMSNEIKAGFKGKTVTGSNTAPAVTVQPLKLKL